MSVQSRFPASTPRHAETVAPAAEGITEGVAVVPTAGATAGAHHRRAVPDEHLCVCGRFRHHCVREAVRAVWTASNVSRGRREQP
jgi:hypothetical protein